MSAVKADYYDLLGVQRDAEPEAIRKAFHAAARDAHPDVSDSPDAVQGPVNATAPRWCRPLSAHFDGGMGTINVGFGEGFSMRAAA